MSFMESALFSRYYSYLISSSSSSRSSVFSYFPTSPSPFRRNPSSVQPIIPQYRRRQSSSSKPDEGSQNSGDLDVAQKEIQAPESFLHRFRRRKGLSVSDLTASEWCEKQMEFTLLCGKSKITSAMKAGRARHSKLEREVSKKVKVKRVSAEDAWAVKFINFIVGANQLSLEGLTRELPIVAFVQNTWILGVIDEIKMLVIETVQSPLLIDTKTRSKATLPSEPQKRNGRLQLMCYKYLWDTLVTNNFPVNDFFNYFGLNPQYILSQEIQDHVVNSGFMAENLLDLVTLFRNTCSTLPLAHEQLLLRYEFQGDHSLLGQDEFTYDSDWLTSQVDHSLEFWSGNRDASYVLDDERWKCRFCSFASICPLCTTDAATSITKR